MGSALGSMWFLHVHNGSMLASIHDSGSVWIRRSAIDIFVVVVFGAHDDIFRKFFCVTSVSDADIRVYIHVLSTLKTTFRILGTARRDSRVPRNSFLESSTIQYRAWTVRLVE